MSVLDHYNHYQTDSRLQWEGLQSNRFKRTKYFLPRRDIIKRGLDIPMQTSLIGKKHYEEKRSPQKTFRSIVKIIPDIEHWHPRSTRKRVSDVSFTEAFPRRQRRHGLEDKLPLTQRSAGIRTFYNTRVRQDNFKDYKVEDRMQRKRRIDQLELRNTFFLKD